MQLHPKTLPELKEVLEDHRRQICGKREGEEEGEEEGEQEKAVSPSQCMRHSDDKDKFLYISEQCCNSERNLSIYIYICIYL